MSVSVRYRPGAVPEAPGAILFVGDGIDAETADRMEREDAAKGAALEALDIELWEVRLARKGGGR